MTEAVTDMITTLIDSMSTTEISSTTYDDGSTTLQDVWTNNSDFNASTADARNGTSEEKYECSVFKVFNILEIIMTSVEVMVWTMAAIKMPRWRRNYRNQMLMQISVARFIKRVIFSIKFFQNNQEPTEWDTNAATLKSAEIYIDFVIVILVFFFIKHMYDSLIIVLVKIRQNSLYKASLCSWLVPIPVSVVWTVIIVCHALNKKVVYLIICCIFRWPLIFLGTALYLGVVYRVLTERIRRFAVSLTVVTFFMCLFINLYLITRDIIELFCIDSFQTQMISYVLGFVMNFLILIFYINLIIQDCKHCNQTSRKVDTIIPNYSLANTCCQITNLNEDDYS